MLEVPKVCRALLKKGEKSNMNSPPHVSNDDSWLIQQDNGPTAEILKVGLGFDMI